MQDTVSFDFSQKRSLHIVGLLVSFSRILVRFLRQGVFWVVLIFARRPELYNTIYFWLAIALFGLFTLIFSYLSYKFYSYHVDVENREFVVEQGVFNKSKTSIKFSNIVQVNVDQNILQKMLSIYGVSINTAGSDKIEADLYALDEETALSLRKFLMQEIHVEQHGAGEPNIEASLSEQTAETLVQIPTKNILLFSLLSNYRQGLALFFAFCAALFQNIQDVMEAAGWEGDYDIDVSTWRAWASGLLLAAVFIVLIPFIINIVRYLFKYYDFSIFRNPAGNFSMRFGLFKTKDIIFHRKRVQTVDYKQNPLLAYFGLGHVTLRQIITDVAVAQESTIEMPGLGVGDKVTVYDLVFGADIYKDSYELRPKIGLFVRNTMFSVLLCALVFVPVLFVAEEAYHSCLWLMFVLIIFLLTLYNYLFYKSYRFYVGDEYLIKRTRVWNLSETVVPIANTQIVLVSQTFWQKRRDTANLLVRTAANDVKFSYFEQKDVQNVSNKLLYRVER